MDAGCGEKIALSGKIGGFPAASIPGPGEAPCGVNEGDTPLGALALAPAPANIEASEG